MARHLSYASVLILQAIAAGVRHGFDIIDTAGLPSGTVYPALGKLEAAGLVQSRWEDARTAQSEKRPTRRYYELRPAGARALADALERLRALERTAAKRLETAKVRP